MKLTKETLKRIIKEEIGATLQEQDEIENSLLDDLGDPLSPEEKEQARIISQQHTDTEDIEDIVQHAIDAGKSKEEFLKMVAAELAKYP